MKNKMKPKIKFNKRLCLWSCTFNGCIALGTTPESAYEGLLEVFYRRDKDGFKKKDD